MRDLVHALVKNRVRPYYIYQCDLSLGIEHFRTSVSAGIQIIESLRGHTSRKPDFRLLGPAQRLDEAIYK